MVKWENMLPITVTTSINEKGYLLLPYRIRRAINLKPRQMVTLRAQSDRKVELEPLLTLEEVFNFVKPTSRKITQKELKDEERLAQEAMAENAASEGL